MKYMIDTEAYQELASGLCPLADNYHAVRRLLQELAQTKSDQPRSTQNDAAEV